MCPYWILTNPVTEKLLEKQVPNWSCHHALLRCPPVTSMRWLRRSGELTLHLPLFPCEFSPLRTANRTGSIHWLMLILQCQRCCFSYCTLPMLAASNDRSVILLTRWALAASRREIASGCSSPRLPCSASSGPAPALAGRCHSKVPDSRGLRSLCWGAGTAHTSLFMWQLSSQ